LIDLDTLFTIAKPILASAHSRRLETLRARHDAAGHALLGAHFTLVFACSRIERSAYAGHVRSIAAQRAGIRFVCRRAIVMEDGAMHYVVLEPLEGRAELIDLHECLHTGLLSRQGRADRPFVPHVTVGKTASKDAAQSLCARLNDEGVLIPGEIASLTVGKLQESKFSEVASFAMGRAMESDGAISSCDN
jgi:2'-5' RNA ligase